MVLSCQPILDALKSVRTPRSKVILLTPQGDVFKQKMALDLSKEEHLIFCADITKDLMKGSVTMSIFKFRLATLY